MDGSKGVEVVEGEHFDVLGDGAARMTCNALAADMAQAMDRRIVTIATNDAITQMAADGVRWQQRALRAEAIVASIDQVLAEYRAGKRDFPMYAELVRLLQG